MDILTQFYNQAGQIVTKTPDMSTREFYRDVMCRHKFNEMFVAARLKNKVGFYVNNDRCKLIFGGGESCEDPAEIHEHFFYQYTGDATYPESIRLIDNGGGWVKIDTPLQYQAGGINVGLVFRSPLGMVDIAEGLSLPVLSGGQTSAYPNLLFYSGRVMVVGNIGSQFNIEKIWEVESGIPEFFTNQSWNIFELQIRDSSAQILINASSVWSQSNSGGVMSLFAGDVSYVTQFTSLTTAGNPSKLALAYSYIEIVR